MGSNGKTGGEVVRLPKLTRRAIIAGTSAATLAGDKVAAAASSRPDEGAKLCAQWLHLDDKIIRLHDRWRKLEIWLARNHGWHGLSEAEREAVPRSQELRDIDGCLEVLYEKRDALLGAMPVDGSASFDGIIAKLAVVERLLWVDEHPEARALIAASVKDLMALSRKGPNYWNGSPNSEASS